jgi:mono/diheme cytochrome c family protein
MFLRAMAVGKMSGRICSFALILMLLVATFACAACNETPPDVRQWRTSDHDHTENPNADQVQVSDAGSSEPGHGLDDVTVVAWQQNCTNCHGPLGRGDGPQGQLLHASDLSRPAWQASITDEAIAATIHQGRGRMPSFNLPDATVTRLVALIRMLNLNRMQQDANAAGDANAGASNNGRAPPRPSSTASASTPAPTRAGR